jgi:Zn-dependent protease with chaperone function
VPPMPAVREIVYSFVFILIIAGCGTAPLSLSVNQWVVHQGGTIGGSRQARAEAVARPLFASCVGRGVAIQVLNTDAVSAFSWRNGRVFVTRGLMDHLDDAELTAVIAHELGHLLSDGQLQTVASLRGCCVDPDREVRADATGLALLRAQGQSAKPMVSMLKKIEEYGSLPPTCRLAMDRRIALLSANNVSSANARP